MLYCFSYYFGFKFENGDIKQCKTQKLRLIEPDTEELHVPDVTFSSVINLPSSDFQKIIRDLNGISDRIEIKSVGNDLSTPRPEFEFDGLFVIEKLMQKIVKDDLNNIEAKKVLEKTSEYGKIHEVMATYDGVIIEY